MKPDEMSMRLLEGNQEGDLSTKQAPILTKMGNRKEVDGPPSLRMQDIGIDLLRIDETQWRFSLLIADSVNTSRGSGRYIVCETRKYPMLLV